MEAVKAMAVVAAVAGHQAAEETVADGERIRGSPHNWQMNTSRATASCSPGTTRDKEVA